MVFLLDNFFLLYWSMSVLVSFIYQITFYIKQNTWACVCVWFFLFIVFHSRVNWSAFEIRFSCEKFVWSKRLRFCLDISFHNIMSTKRGRGGGLDPFKLDWDMNPLDLVWVVLLGPWRRNRADASMALVTNRCSHTRIPKIYHSIGVAIIFNLWNGFSSFHVL